MKILLIGRYNDSEMLSGPEKFSKILFAHLAKKAEVVFIEYYFKYKSESNLINRLFGQETICSDPSALRLGIIRLFIFLIRYKPSIIHILTAERFIIPIYLYKFLFKGKIITTFHTILKYEIPRTLNKKNELNKYRDYIWEYLAIKLSDKLIFLTIDHLLLAEKYYHIKRNHVEIIPNGIEEEFFNDERKFKVNDKLNIIFYNGINGSINRGLDLIIRLLNNLNEKKFKLFVIGDKINHNEIYFDIEFVNPMNKKDLIIFLENKNILLKSIAFDTFSIFAAECMASGLIVIVSNNVGISSYINNGKNGFVYDKNQPDEIGKILSDLVYNKYDYEFISNSAKEIRYKLDWHNISNNYFECYKNTI